MRVTSEMQTQQALLNVQQTFSRMSQIQNQITSGNQINNASDNPVGMVQILQNNTQNTQLTTDLAAIQSASNVLQTGVTSLTNAQQTLTSAINTAQIAAQASTSPGSYTGLASQINSDINQLLGLANTQLSDGTYIFGGTSNTKPPFTVTSLNGHGQPATISYQGSQNASKAIVASAVTVNTLIPGSSVFQPNISGATVYSGNTGTQAGTGFDTATGQGTLQVQHTLTTFAGSSGVAAGASSATGDTILGPSGANNLVIDDTSGTGASGTVSLNGGPAVEFTNADTDLEVTGPNGEIVHLDTTAISAGFNGTVAIQSDGTLSTDGGASTTPINFSANQTVTNSVTGATTNVNTTNVRQAGNEQLSYAGPSDLFQTLISLRDAINNTQGLSTSDRATAIDQQIAQLQNINTSLATPIGAQSSQAQFLSNLQTRTQNMQTNLKEATNNIQSTDMASAIVALQQQQTLYQGGLEIAAGLNQLTIANYINV